MSEIQLKRLLNLNRMLFQEMPEFLGWMPLFGKNEEDQLKLFQALMTMRKDRPVSEQFLKAQDEFLRDLNSPAVIPPRIRETTEEKACIYFWKGDPWLLAVDGLAFQMSEGQIVPSEPRGSALADKIFVHSGIQLKNLLKKDAGAGAKLCCVVPGFNLPAENLVVFSNPAGVSRNQNELFQKFIELAVEKGWKNLAFQWLSQNVMDQETVLNNIHSILEKFPENGVERVFLIE